MTKSELRKAFMLERRALTSTEHAQKTNSIVGRLFRTINLSRIQSVHCFISMRQADEIDTARIFELLWRERPTIATFAPRIDETTSELETVRYAATTELKANKWSINEPVGIAIADPGIIDLVVVPLLCFDERGHRVGYGKGYYDRFLQRCRHDCIKAGLSLFPPVDRIDDVHSGDVPLDVCITPDRSYSFDRTN